ncbi:MAG: GWxTD domain-containing protein [Gemmatimonadaceae bacterium]|nr:GWxTD domain-containing protein [Gemmatimonadaceae bacterium]
MTTRALAYCAFSALVLSACAGSRPAPGPPAGTPPAGAPGAPGGPGGPATGAQTTAADMQRLYRSLGLIAGSGAMPFTASVSFLRAPSLDSTLTLFALSLPSRVLGFTREGDRYVASYNARLEVRQGGTIIKTIEATEQVRVPTFRETSRTDESIIWQQFLRLAPGRYTLTLGVKDGGSLRAGTEEVALDVPRLSPTTLGTPVPVYEAIPRQTSDSLPRILARPRSTVVFGVDSVLPVYVDAVGESVPSTVAVRIIDDGDVTLWDSTFALPSRSSGRSTTLGIPVARMGIGINRVVLVPEGSSDTARTRVLVSLGDDLPIATFDEMLSYLRYFTTADRVRELRDAGPTRRAEVWSRFLKETDPVPATAEHEGLRDYFARIRAANVRFRDDAQIGWQSDRGTAFVALGDPDNITDTGLIDPNARVRQQIWDYRELRAQLVFVDQTGFGRWRLSTQGRADLDAAIRRKQALQQR